MKKIISIILCIATIFSCVSCCFAAPDEYASLIEGDESFDIGWPNFICDDENKEVFYTKGSLRTAEKYAEGILILCAPMIYVFQVCLIMTGVKLIAKTYDYTLIEVENDDFYYNYVGEGNFIY